jgi:hypothetical protein
VCPKPLVSGKAYLEVLDDGMNLFGDRSAPRGQHGVVYCQAPDGSDSVRCRFTPLPSSKARRART